MAFFAGHQVMHLIDILVQPAIFMSVYYTLTLPEIKFIHYYISALWLPSYLACRTVSAPAGRGMGAMRALEVLAPDCEHVAASIPGETWLLHACSLHGSQLSFASLNMPCRKPVACLIGAFLLCPHAVVTGHRQFLQSG